MNIQYNDEAYANEFTQLKKVFFDKNGKSYKMVEFMKANGISDDEIFIAHLLGMYKGCLEMGIKI